MLSTTCNTAELADLPLFQRREPVAKPPKPGTLGDVEWFVDLLTGRDWITAGDILNEVGINPTAPAENLKRQLRRLADGSGGRVAGHQRGYKIADALRARVIESDRIFYGRAAVA